MIKTYKYRIYPSDFQIEQIKKTFGCCRYVYNTYLAKRTEIYNNTHKNFDYYQCAKDLTQLKKEQPWLAEADSIALQNTLRELDSRFQIFFKNKHHYPSPKKKKSHCDSYTTGNRTCIEYKGQYIKLPKLGLVKTKNKLKPTGRILKATVSLTSSNQYFVSLVCTDVDMPVYPVTGRQIGIDLGIKEYYTTSNGDTLHNPKYYKNSLKKIKRLQRKLRQKEVGSANYEKARMRLAKAHERVANQRKDFIHKATSSLLKNYDVICVENLQISKMKKNPALSQSVVDVAWGTFIQQLEYKSAWFGRKVVKVDTWFPSSQMCHVCGYINKDTKDLNVRRWQCPICNTEHDRDINASINILNEGLKLIQSEQK